MFETSITQFTPKENEDNNVGTVVLRDGTVLPADIVIIGIGSTFNTDWLKDSSVEMLEDGSVIVDEVYITLEY